MLFQGEIKRNSNNTLIIRFKSFHRANFNKTWYKAFWVRDIIAYTKRPSSFRKGDNNEIAKMH